MKSLTLVSLVLLGTACGSNSSKSESDTAPSFKTVDTTPGQLQTNLGSVVAFAKAESSSLGLMNGSISDSKALDAEAKVITESLFATGREDIALSENSKFLLGDGQLVMIFNFFEVVYKQGELADPNAPDINTQFDLTLDGGIRLRQDCGFMVKVNRSTGEVKCLSKNVSSKEFTFSEMKAVFTDDANNVYLRTGGKITKIDPEGNSSVVLNGADASSAEDIKVSGSGMIYAVMSEEKGKVIAPNGDSLAVNLIDVQVRNKYLVLNESGNYVAYNGSTEAIELTLNVSVGDTGSALTAKDSDNKSEVLYSNGVMVSFDFDNKLVSKDKVVDSENISAAAIQDDGSIIYASGSTIFKQSTVTGLVSSANHTEILLEGIECYGLIVDNGKVLFSGSSDNEFVTGTLDLTTKEVKTTKSEFKMTEIEKF